MKRFSITISVLMVAGLLVLACAAPPAVVPGEEPASQPASGSESPAAPVEEPAEGSGAIQTGEAVVESVDALILESFPVQVNVVAVGYLPDGCTTIGEVTSQQNGNEFKVTITTERPADAMCTEAIVPYEEVIPLDVAGLPAGQYTVTVNGVSTTFELAIDNVLPDSE